FVATCILSGAVWLVAGGAVFVRYGWLVAGPEYDAALHAIFLGFVFPMLFGHAPIVFPAILGRPIPFHARFYAHVALLEASLALRLAADASIWTAGRRASGLLNAIALAVFLANT